MTIAFRRTALAAAMALMASGAGAATVTYNAGSIGADDFSVSSSTKQPNDTLVFQYTAVANFDIEGFSITANGGSGGSDISALRVDYAINGTPIATDLVFGPSRVSGGRANSSVFLSGYERIQDGDVFTLLFRETTVRPVALTIVFDTVAVPLPAAGGILALALVGGGMAVRRRRKA